MEDLDGRLDAAIKRRDFLTAQASRIAGRKEAAEKALSEVHKEIRKKNLDPETLDETITKLETAYKEAVETFESEVAEASESLAPFMENSDEDSSSED